MWADGHTLPCGQQPSPQAPTAIVVGAGIGGMATALLLARAGAHVTLLEKVDASVAVGAGLLLHPNGLAVLAPSHPVNSHSPD